MTADVQAEAEQAPAVQTAVDTDRLPPTQYLILEVLAARYRTGETHWTFPDRCAKPAKALEEAGLIWLRSGPVQDCFEARFTDAGKTAALSGDYHPPTDRDAAADGLRWAADRIDPGPVTEGFGPVAFADRNITNRLRLWADQIRRGAIDVWKETP